MSMRNAGTSQHETGQYEAMVQDACGVNTITSSLQQHYRDQPEVPPTSRTHTTTPLVSAEGVAAGTAYHGLDIKHTVSPQFNQQYHIVNNVLNDGNKLPNDDSNINKGLQKDFSPNLQMTSTPCNSDPQSQQLDHLTNKLDRIAAHLDFIQSFLKMTLNTEIFFDL